MNSNSYFCHKIYIIPLFEITTAHNCPILFQEIEKFGVELTVKREDQIHPIVSGNKFRKLKYNLKEAQNLNCNALVTFGGAFSNHIAAVAAAGRAIGMPTVGIIRGEELATMHPKNTTLAFAEDCGMKLEFVSRAKYKERQNPDYLEAIQLQYPNSFVIPEGGTNILAVQGCEEMLTKEDQVFDYICVPVGTGGTLAGLVRAAKPHQKVIGYSALKGIFQISEIEKYTQNKDYQIKDSYCFGGYAKIDSTLIRFMNKFKAETGILLDPVYTAKMLFGIITDIQSGFFPKNSRILAIHTGGIQGISGMNEKLKSKNLPQINL